MKWSTGETQVLLADPEDRRSFIDMRVLLVRGDMGDGESIPASPRAGLSPRSISKQEPKELGEEEEKFDARVGEASGGKGGWAETG